MINKQDFTLVCYIGMNDIDCAAVFQPLVVQGGRVHNKVKSNAADQRTLVKDARGQFKEKSMSNKLSKILSPPKQKNR